MIKAKFIYSKTDFKEFTVTGHSNSAKHGKDLICAAVSAIVTCGLEALKDGDENYEVKVDEGNVSLKAKIKQSDHDKVVIETIETQIKAVATSNPKFVTLERKIEE